MSLPLSDRLKRRLARLGPMTLAEYMVSCLHDPQAGYYRTHDPLGAAGDFITAPEISQLFGEMLGVWLIDAWHKLGAPTPVNLVELGPGRGTLLADALRVIRLAPGLDQAVQLHLVESNETLRRAQEAALRGRPARWHERLEALPAGPLLLLANEFFDALPIRQFEKTPEGWRERLVGLNDQGDLTFRLSGALPPTLSITTQAPVGAVLEISAAGRGICGEIAHRVARDGGAALIIDYGYEEAPLKGTLQAIEAQRFADPLANPGRADLSAHVDFAALRQAAEQEGAVAYGPVTQGTLLRQLGIAERAARLAQDPHHAAQVQSALVRLTAADAMGSLFKALALMPAAIAPPLGFATPKPANTP